MSEKAGGAGGVRGRGWSGAPGLCALSGTHAPPPPHPGVCRPLPSPWGLLRPLLGAPLRAFAADLTSLWFPVWRVRFLFAAPDLWPAWAGARVGNPRPVPHPQTFSWTPESHSVSAAGSLSSRKQNTPPGCPQLPRRQTERADWGGGGGVTDLSPPGGLRFLQESRRGLSERALITAVTGGHCCHRWSLLSQVVPAATGDGEPFALSRPSLVQMPPERRLKAPPTSPCDTWSARRCLSCAFGCDSHKHSHRVTPAFAHDKGRPS